MALDDSQIVTETRLTVRLNGHTLANLREMLDTLSERGVSDTAVTDFPIDVVIRVVNEDRLDEAWLEKSRDVELTTTSSSISQVK